ncbi:uncharacterized protein LOC141541368 isoform X2 [Sminthopsis crassicaudata]|uniref:uncharacterized protein LOC141541368 isoform X2 n=1 Tax=Sminthopsis crassicaudata TaxID=9301 RepID=UPI003D698433
MLTLDSKIKDEIREIKWYFESKNLLLLTTSPMKINPRWIISWKEYDGRLSILGDMTLKLSDLTTEDSGCYKADIISVSGGITTQKYNLTVLETDNTEPNVNPQNRSHYFAILSLGVFMFLLILIPCVCYLRSQGTHRRSKSQTEENGAEEEYKHSQMASLHTDTQRLRIPGALTVTTIQEVVVEMQNGLGTQPEDSRDQHRQQLGDEERNSTESMDHRRTAQIEAA